MKIAIPTETKVHEGRIALTPDAVASLVQAGHQVAVQHNGGLKAGYTTEEYLNAGALILGMAREIYQFGELIVKVKEPVGQELDLLQANHTLFSYLHLAPEPALTQRLCDIGLTAIAFETVEDEQGRLPLLAPMSDVAGRLAVQAASNLLFHQNGGRGLLLGGLPCAERGNVVIIGAGVAGINAARVAAGMGANVTVFDINRDKLELARSIGPNVTALYSTQQAINQAVVYADIVIGAVLITGKRAPHVVSADVVSIMKPGSIIVDISVDQGGCIETTRPTTHAEPTYVHDGVVHYAVTNMPGAVPRSSTQALSAAILPYVHTLANEPENTSLTSTPRGFLPYHWVRKNNELARGCNIYKGELRINF